MIITNNLLIFTKWSTPVAIFGAFLITIFGAYSITDYSRFPWGEEADVNPYAWMTNTLNRIGNHPVNKLAELLPNNFKKL